MKPNSYRITLRLCPKPAKLTKLVVHYYVTVWILEVLNLTLRTGRASALKGRSGNEQRLLSS